jgi:hypothetical protein
VRSSVSTRCSPVPGTAHVADHTDLAQPLGKNHAQRRAWREGLRRKQAAPRRPSRD